LDVSSRTSDSFILLPSFYLQSVGISSQDRNSRSHRHHFDGFYVHWFASEELINMSYEFGCCKFRNLCIRTTTRRDEAFFWAGIARVRRAVSIHRHDGRVLSAPLLEDL